MGINVQGDYSALNQAINNALQHLNIHFGNVGYSRGKGKGTATYYIMAHEGNKKVCYTLNKTYHDGKFGFWSWIQTSYKNGMIKRTKFAKSGSRAMVIKRAKRLADTVKNGKNNVVERLEI